MWIISDDFYHMADMNAIRSYEWNEGRNEGLTLAVRIIAESQTGMSENR